MQFSIPSILNRLKNQKPTQTGCLKMTKNTYNGPSRGCFWSIWLPWNAKKDICLHSLGILSNKMSYNFWLSLFLQKKVTIFVFFEILVPNIFENISKSVRFLRKAMNTCFVANLTSFQENFKLLKSVACSQSYALKSQSHFFSIRLYIHHHHHQVTCLKQSCTKCTK